MSVIDEVLQSNAEYARDHVLSHLTPRPRRHIAVVTCMDTRLSKKTLGLATGDAHIIRNAGGIVTEDVLRSLLISHYLLGTQEFMIINHTDCGLGNSAEEEIRRRIEESAGATSVVPAVFHAFRDVDENVRQQLQKLRSHALIPPGVPIRGFVYEVETGRLREVLPG
jgi:carbonic anhydrase